MIKRLRLQFVATTVVLVAVMLAVILGIVCYTTYSRMERETSETLERMAKDQQRPTKPARPAPTNATGETEGAREGHKEEDAEAMHEHPCFILFYDESGNLVADGHPYYDLSDTQKLNQILQEAIATGDEEGILRSRDLHFLKNVRGDVTEYIFADVAGQRHTLRVLCVTSCLIFISAMAAFWCLSWWLSKRFVRPVEQAWAQQRQFVADASHELKTPLTVILTNAQMLQSQEYGPEANQRLVDGIVTTATQMRGLTEGLLTLAKTDARPANNQLLTALNISELTENCAMCFEPMYFEAGRTLDTKIQSSVYVRGSNHQLQQVVDILLDNGRKYSLPGSQVQLILEQSRGNCTLRVKTRGETLTAQQCKDIFQRFYRVDEARSRNGSYGLGLPIAAAIVREHRGRIYAQGKDGVNTFTVTLPTCNP